MSAHSKPYATQMLLSLRPFHQLPLLLRRRQTLSLRRLHRRTPAALMASHREAFARRMAMAGIKPHHRIALGVSGGPDSMAMCVLTAGWKADGGGSAEGVLAIVVDHRLRNGSSEEAELVRDRVSRMGIKCEIKCCDWPDGRPKQGHLQEAAREMRYQIFCDVCIEQQIGVLLIAHHADDQAELFILRLSRNSGVLGLAGTAFVSQLFPTHLKHYGESFANQGILLVRPMLEFSKEDMYKICQEENQECVEDPTNQNQLFARNRIRSSLSSLPSCAFRLEMQNLISACRSTRSYVESTCQEMIKYSVTIMDHGYAIIDLEKLEPSNVENICLSKFMALILQFISQKHRPIRGTVSQLLIDYMRNIPCKTSLTAGGCYLSPAPRSRGTQILVCSADSTQSSRIWLSHKYSSEDQQPSLPRELDQIILDAKSYSDQLVPKSSDVPFLHVNSSELLIEAKKLNLIGESSFSNILLLQQEEYRKFSTGTQNHSDHEPRHEMKHASTSSISLHSSETCHFMNRFLVSWKHDTDDTVSGIGGVNQNSELKNSRLCPLCMAESEGTVGLRHLIEADWLYLARVSQCQMIEDGEGRLEASTVLEQNAPKTKVKCSRYMQLTAHRALKSLKSVPIFARRGLPVLVNSQDLPLSIPSICFNACPCLSVEAIFMPRVPLGGGYNSYI